MTPRMFRSARKCCPSDSSGQRITSRARRRRRSRRSSPELLRVLVPRERERRDRVDDVGRLVRAPADGLRREVRAVRLGEQPVGGHLSRRDPQVRGLAVGHVARERDVVAALERRPSRSGEEKQWRTTSRRRPRVRRPSPRSPPGCGRRPGAPARRRARAARRRAPLLTASRRRKVVQPRLPHGDRARVGEQLAELVEPVGLGAAGLVRVDAEHGEDPAAGPQARARAARLDPRADGEDALTPASTRARRARRGRVWHASRCACVSITRRRPGRRSGEERRGRRDPVRCGREPVGHALPPSSAGCPSAPGSARSCRACMRRARSRRRADRRPGRTACGRARPRALVLRELPGAALDVTVEGAHDLPDPLERARDVVRSRLPATSSASPASAAATGEPASGTARSRRPGIGRSSPSSARAGCRGRSRAPARTARRCRRATRSRPGRTTPPGCPEAHGIGAVDVDQVERVDDVAERLGDLPVVEEQVAVDEELLGGSYPAASSSAGQ